MSDEKQETIADVVREMRNGRIPQHLHDDELLRKFADRIEAKDSELSGKCYEAIVRVQEAIDRARNAHVEKNGGMNDPK